ncbi:prokaryotic phospholipase A2-domain-containing protein [Microdochium bolleyi]|uniref:Prokaryotic phospholipase A2-domain-containing protein n=1 Tax=Microdochium bolleyi TaxID=196109 RepID=A0A136J5Y7_9PEZI|nr:prokaryotic phospholipase A2-domain-containing protein [Microdochium bolleyi]
MKFTVILPALVTLGLANPIPSADPVIEERQTAALNTATERLLFSSTIGAFVTARNARNPAGLDWTSDGCSSSPDNPFGFGFTNSCYRHDFGYRNYKKQNRFTDANKLRIDNNFRTDLYNQCANEGNQGVCRTTADVYYQAVRWFGNRQSQIVEEENGDLVLMVEGEEVRRVPVRR